MQIRSGQYFLYRYLCKISRPKQLAPIDPLTVATFVYYF